MGTAIVDWREKKNNYPIFCNVTDCLSFSLSTHSVRFLRGHKLKDDLLTGKERIL